MTKIAIFDRNAGFYQWVSEKTTKLDALIEFDNAVGVFPNKPADEDITEADADAWSFYEIDAEQEKALDDWVDRGSCGDFPLESHPKL